MAYPTYNSATDIPTDANTEGRWKGFMIIDSGDTGKDVKVRMFNGEDVLFEGVTPLTVYPFSFNKIYSATTTVTNGKLVGLN